MKKNLLLFAAAALLLLAFSGCKKEPLTTTGSLVFWQTKATQQANQSLGITAYYFYVAGKYQGSMGVNQYWNVAPDCGDAGAVTFKMDMEGASSKTVSYEVKDQDGDVWYTGSEQLPDGDCVQLELQ
jgi:hypothetical protein